MKTNDPSQRTMTESQPPKERDWFYNTFGPRSFDFLIGVAAAVAVYAVACASSSVQHSGNLPALLLGFGAIGVAILAVALTALAILVGNMGEEYLRVLEHAGGMKAALQPFKIVATVAGLTTIVSIGALLLWPIERVQPELLATSTGLAVWSTIGSVQLVFMTAFHGAQRGELLDIIRDARRQLSPVTPLKEPVGEANASGSSSGA
jgi:hypothetical protein